ncbi:MAG: peptidoglycan-binding domain-containing protein [Gammaproteobacteria bacterium]|nr:peptidoglycan-binding domain-containing protein [Gammaproteobacteria bacterium]
MLELWRAGETSPRHLALTGIEDGTPRVRFDGESRLLPMEVLERYLARPRHRALAAAALLVRGAVARRPGVRASAGCAAAASTPSPGSPSGEPPSDRFDADLEQRLRAFQSAQGLRPDGIAGPQTWIRINSLSAVGVPSLATGGER